MLSANPKRNITIDRLCVKESPPRSDSDGDEITLPGFVLPGFTLA
jgi:hypothetical protein